MAKKGKKADHHQNEVLENPEVIASGVVKTEQFLEKNKIAVLSVVGVVAIAIAGILLYQYWNNSQNAQAQDEMFQAVYYFEQDSLDLALRGDGNQYGFLDIIEEYSSTETGNLANFYAGTVYMNKGQYRSAIPFLEDFSSSDLMLQARAYSMLGDAYMEEADYTKAAEYFVKAAGHKANEYFSPTYLIKAGLAYEMLNENSKAIAQYSEIIDKYKKSAEYDKAMKYKAKLEAQS